MLAPSSPPNESAPTDASFQQLDTILSSAFGIADGYQELNRVVVGAVGFNLYENISASEKAMALVVPELRTALMVEPAKAATCLKATYEELAGNAELRDWIAANCPAIAPLVSQERFEAERSGYEADRLRRRVGAIDTSLQKLAPGIKLTAEGKKLAHTMLERLDDLSDYKRIHDELHKLQMEVMNELARLSQTEILPSERQLSVPVQLGLIDNACKTIAGCFVESSAPEQAVIFRSSVIDEIQGIADLLRGGSFDSGEKAGVAAGLLRRMLRVQMVLFDNLLVAASEQIPFTKFAALLLELPQPNVDRATGGDPNLFINVSRNFQDIAVRLVSRRIVHRLWQKLEATILNVEELARGAGTEQEFAIHWANATRYIDEIATLSSDPTVRAMTEIDDLAPGSSALRKAPWNAAFALFSRLARARFQIADNALLDDCKQLKQLHEPLKRFLGE